MKFVQQARWDVEDLHRHADYAPIKKEPVQPKPAQREEDSLPPPRVNITSRNNGLGDSPVFDGDGEFGSRLWKSILYEV